MPDSEEHYDIYLARNLYPVLLPGVELLAREIDRLTNKESQGELRGRLKALLSCMLDGDCFSNSHALCCLDKIDPSIRARFNPCIFLAEYLMRNNPTHGAKLEYAELFEQ